MSENSIEKIEINMSSKRTMQLAMSLASAEVEGTFKNTHVKCGMHASGGTSGITVCVDNADGSTRYLCHMSFENIFNAVIEKMLEHENTTKA